MKELKDTLIELGFVRLSEDTGKSDYNIFKVVMKIEGVSCPIYIDVSAKKWRLTEIHPYSVVEEDTVKDFPATHADLIKTLMGISFTKGEISRAHKIQRAMLV